MPDILKELYEEKFYTDWRITPEYQALAQQASMLWEKVEPLLGREVMEQLTRSEDDLSYQTNYEWFRKGFRLGASLMLELL